MHVACNFTLQVGGQRIALAQDRVYLVGSADGSDVKVNHSSVAGRHCTISPTPSGIAVEDLGSEHGTWIEGGRITHSLLRPGQALRVGTVELRVRDASAPPRLPAVHRDPRALNFTDVMAAELRRAPWFLVSLVVHAALLLLLSWWLQPTPIETHTNVGLSILPVDPPPDPVDAVEAPPREEIIVDQSLPEVSLAEDIDAQPFQAPKAPDRFEDLTPIHPGLQGNSGWLQGVRKGSDGVLQHPGVKSGGFGTVVHEIRKTGLEIVFVFDSTGSMGGVLQGTRQRIAHLVEILQALVPDARLGAVTYRDRDPSEEYLTRHAPLGPDPYRVVNFLHVINAEGGGDREESVLDGLKTAFGMAWHEQARRVVVLVGDAPPHKRDESKIQSAVRGFVANGRSYVHAIVTSSAGASRLPTDTQAAFAKIAKTGRGKCIGFEDDTLVLQQVLSLAFGTQFRSNLDQVSELLSGQAPKIATAALDAVRRADLVEIEKALRRTPVPADLVNALLRGRNQKIAAGLAELLSRDDFPEAGRQAASHVLQRWLELPLPPVNPERGGALTTEQLNQLRAKISQRL